ncbi:hypothetical protein [Comamonas testosteroni]|nr:hypothetical protein [Comamonas testosteroni]
MAATLSSAVENPSKNEKKELYGLAVAAVICVAIYTQLTVFVVPPIGIMPEGKTIIIPRQSNMQFVDSPDGMCERMKAASVFFAEASLSLLRERT